MILLSSNSCDLYTFYERYISQQLLLPTHQRGDVWTKSKKKKWWSDIEDIAQKGTQPRNRMVPGCIITYTIKGDSRVYINDGANRVIHSIIEYIEECKRDGKDYSSILRKCYIVDQYVEYDSAEEAIEHFININIGTTATPYEILSSNFTIKLDDYDNVWKPLLNRVYSIVDNALYRLGCKTKNTREKKHKDYRDSLCIFYRFITGEAGGWSPSVAIKSLNPETIKDESNLEIRLSNKLKEIGSVEMKRQLDCFEKFVNSHYALYQQIWSELGKSQVISPSLTHFRWWLTVAVYCKNNNCPPERFREFTKLLINETDGRTTIFYTDEKTGRRCNANAALSKLSCLTMILRGLGLPTYYLKENSYTRFKDNVNLKPGFVSSHIKSFCDNGNGDTIYENAIDNSHRGSKNMTEEEINRLRGL